MKPQSAQRNEQITLNKKDAKVKIFGCFSANQKGFKENIEDKQSKSEAAEREQKY
jgi:hypothetical protein